MDLYLSVSIGSRLEGEWYNVKVANQLYRNENFSPIPTENEYLIGSFGADNVFYWKRYSLISAYMPENRFYHKNFFVRGEHRDEDNRYERYNQEGLDKLLRIISEYNLEWNKKINGKYPTVELI